MLTINFNDGSKTSVECTMQDVMKELELQEYLCDTTQFFLVEPLKITGFKYEAED